jgi:hypothetical protein
MPYIENLGIWPDWGVGHRRRWPWVRYKKTFLGLRPSEGALICSILIARTQVMLRKAYFLRRGSWLRPESWAPRPRIQNSYSYWDAHTNGLMFKISDGRTDGRTTEFWNLESLGYLPYKFWLSDRRTVQKFGCASQKNKKIVDCQSICNMWQVYKRPPSASDFFFGGVSIGKVKSFFIVVKMEFKY